VASFTASNMIGESMKNKIVAPKETKKTRK
jgi:hypothetical protein